MNTALKTALVATVVLGMTATTAMASLVSGTAYLVPDATAMNAAPSTLIGLTPSATFVAPSTPLSFDSSAVANGYTLGGFLASGGATNITYLNGATPGANLDGSLYNFTGQVSVTNGQTFTLGHDDGATLVINGATVLSDPGPTAFTTNPITYTGPTGTFAFQLVFGECCSAPAKLLTDLPLITPGVPEPASLAIVGAGLIGLAAVRFRR